MPTVSVVIPVLDDSAMLARCLADLAAQLRPADEIVVVDNGSADDTVAVARAAGVRVIEQRLRGIWPAAAAGYDAATGDIIARLDADSRPPADWLLHLEAELVDSPRSTC
ncbi:glycosyltransferase [Leifsonia xyli]|uniref:glycosyltransferase n=1 Tax=Leifsonia xyli TaxID=1575 RepID=UPI003D6653ED